MDAFLQGMAEFNAGRYFESHETWESLWRETAYPAKLFLLGLTKLAAGLAHTQRGNAHGAGHLLRSGLAYMGPFPADYAGVRLEPLRQRVRECMEPGARCLERPPRVEPANGV